jgi:hypothetical protein
MSFFSGLAQVAGTAIGAFFGGSTGAAVGGAIGGAVGSAFGGSSGQSSGASAGVRATLASGAATRNAIRKEGFLGRQQSLLKQTTESAKERQKQITGKGGTGYNAPNAIQPTKATTAVQAVNSTIADVYKTSAQQQASKAGSDDSLKLFDDRLKKFAKQVATV